MKVAWELSSIQDIYLKFDKQRLKQVILNLAWNAIKLSQNYGLIKIKVDVIDQ